MVTQITAHMKEATEIREIGKKENALAIKDSQDAQTALTNAIAVIQAHYKESGEVAKEDWEFIQARRAPVELPNTPSTWDSAYTAVADPKEQPKGIITVLEQVSADFAQMESDTAAQESEVKGQERARQLEKQKSLEHERKAVAGELEATEQYLKDLQPACVTGDSTYEARKASRSKEIQALKEAQTLLQSAFEGDEAKDEA